MTFEGDWEVALDGAMPSPRGGRERLARSTGRTGLVVTNAVVKIPDADSRAPIGPASGTDSEGSGSLEALV